MSNVIKFTLVVGGVYELRGNGGKIVRFRFIHANSGKPTIEVNGKQLEVESILSLITPEAFQGLYAVDAPAHF